MDRIPQFVYGAGPTTLTLTYPVEVWHPQDATVGAARTAVSGVPGVDLGYRDALLGLTLRCTEAEWPGVRDFIRHALGQQSVTWYPDAAGVLAFPVFLHEPVMGESWEPSRDVAYPRLYTMPIVLRAVPGQSLWLPYFEDDGS